MKPFEDQEIYFTMSLQELYDLRETAKIDAEQSLCPHFKQVMEIVTKTLDIYIKSRLEIAAQLRYIRTEANKIIPIKNQIND